MTLQVFCGTFDFNKYWFFLINTQAIVNTTVSDGIPELLLEY